MAREFAIKFYKSKEWRKLREKYFKANHGLCERCQRPAKIVHHKKYITPRNIDDVSITLNWSNLELLCIDCHNNEHMANELLENNLMFDENGNVVKRNQQIAPH